MAYLKLSSALLLIAVLVTTTGCFRRKSRMINAIVNSSNTKYLGEAELEPGDTYGEIEVTDHLGVYPELQFHMGGPAMEVSNVVFFFEDGSQTQIDESRVLDDEEPNWEINLEDFESAVTRVTFTYSLEDSTDEPQILKLYGIPG